MQVRLSLQDLINQDFSFGIVGLGEENRRFLTWVLQTAKINPARIQLADINTPTLEYPLEQFGSVFFGENYLDICHSDITHLFKAPGIWSLKPEFESFRAIHGINSIHSSLCFFMEHLRTQIIGVTGTKGKTTTSSLIKYLISSNDFGNQYQSIYGQTPTVIYSGNTTNTSPYDSWKDLAKPVDPHQFFVLELSSFQLQDIGYDSLSPIRAAITNYFVDHQDQHASIEEYWHAKNQMFTHQRADGYLVAGVQIQDKVATDTMHQKVQWMSDELADDLFDTIKTQIIGHHNRVNLSLALLTCCSILYPDLSVSDLEQSARDFLVQYPHVFAGFEGLKHRLQLITTLETEFELVIDNQPKHYKLIIAGINDSQGTMPDATSAGIKALTQRPNEHLWLLLSGKNKGGSADELCKTIVQIQANKQLFRIDYYGDVGGHIRRTVQKIAGDDFGSNQLNCTLKEGFSKDCSDIAGIITDFQKFIQNKIDTTARLHQNETSQYKNLTDSLSVFYLNIVLSPGGASFDEFLNYQERGDWFSAQITKCFGES